MGLKAVIFDLDGTLYDNGRLFWMLPLSELLCLRLGYLGRERSSRKALRGQSFATREEFYQHLYSNISRRHPERAERWYNRHYMPLQTRLLQHFCKADAWVRPRLEQLRSQGIKVALYSDYDFAEQKLRALNLDPELFDLIAEAPTLGGLKPDRHLAQRVLDRLGVRADEAMFVGDREDTDVASALSVGARYQLLVRRGKEVSFVDQLPA